MGININYTTGYAGTGKSTSLIEKLKGLPLEDTVVIAPTHKALHRLLNEILNLNLGTVEIRTIHSLLGWIPTINEEAKHINHIDATHKLDKELDEYKHIVIDEAGMMSEEMFMEIISKLEMQLDYGQIDKDITLHLYLDPYQLLPVKGTQIEVDEEYTTRLLTQYRADSLDVVALYTKFVKYIEMENTSDLTTPYSDNVLPLDIKNFKVGDRLLAFTNKAVGEWNKKIAKHLGIDSYEGQEVQLGNKIELVECSKFIEPTLRDLVMGFETGKLDLQNAQISKKFLESSLKALIDHKDIKFITDGHTIYPVIVGIGHANIVIKRAKERALEDKKMFKHVYALGRAYIMDYGFATTVHKSQGSEFDNVFVDKKDIQKSIMNNYYGTYARLMYVAISRAKKTIYI